MKTLFITNEFIIDAPVQYVFPLACPVSEYKWIPGWKTKLIYCPNGKNEEGVIFKEKMSTPFIMGKAFGKTTWKTLLHNSENHKIHFSWDNKISTSIFKIEMFSFGINQTKCVFNLSMNNTNEKGGKVLNQKGEYKINFLLTGLGRMLKQYCENNTMLNPKGSKRKIEFLNSLTTTEKLVFLLGKLNLKFTYDRDKVSYLSSGIISKRSLNKKPN